MVIFTDEVESSTVKFSGKFLSVDDVTLFSFVASVEGEMPHPNFIPKNKELEARTNKIMNAMILLKVNPDMAEYKMVKKKLINSPVSMLNNNLLWI